LTPIGHGVTALRAVLIEGRSDLPLAGDGGLVLLVAISTAYLAAGIITFTLGERLARRQGSLGRY